MVAQFLGLNPPNFLENRSLNHALGVFKQVPFSSNFRGILIVAICGCLLPW